MAQANPIGSKTVLIVDDDSDALDEMAEALEDHGLRVLAATDGEQALALAKTYRPTFVLVDYNLPRRNGLMVVSEMRRFLPQAVFIMISGLDSFCHQATTANTRTFAVLKKPVSMDNVARFIRNSFEQSGDKVLDASKMLTA